MVMKSKDYLTIWWCGVGKINNRRWIIKVEPNFGVPTLINMASAGKAEAPNVQCPIGGKNLNTGDPFV